MTEFYKELTPEGFGIAIKKKATLFSEQSEFQKVEIIDSIGDTVAACKFKFCRNSIPYKFYIE